MASIVGKFTTLAFALDDGSPDEPAGCARSPDTDAWGDVGGYESCDVGSWSGDGSVLCLLEAGDPVLAEPDADSCIDGAVGPPRRFALLARLDSDGAVEAEGEAVASSGSFGGCIMVRGLVEDDPCDLFFIEARRCIGEAGTRTSTC